MARIHAQKDPVVHRWAPASITGSRKSVLNDHRGRSGHSSTKPKVKSRSRMGMQPWEERTLDSVRLYRQDRLIRDGSLS